MKNSLVIACDFPGRKELEGFMDFFGNEKLFLKIGMEMFYQEGPGIIHTIKDAGHDIFLDLKLHDIPNTVKSAMKGLAKLDVNMVNVHAAGGRAMMEAALEGLEAGTASGNKRPACIAVTQLTSTSTSQMNLEQLIPGEVRNSVLHYAALTRHAGLDGVVCSSHEARDIHKKLGQGFLTVTPGIRPSGSDLHDQKRVATPSNARMLGSDIIVVGRAITSNPDPYKAYMSIRKEWEGAAV
ncbi:orotidine-5'-phosphate decarboxylase [Peribacillus sp. SCS-155]|uniref:orotidine-5'-phosphate decarboxylase n=1 Tax=Peribacillus sedimenti TaxID=3115297 RepID=UPI0039069E16